MKLQVSTPLLVDRRGFTLIEVVIVLVVSAILMTVAMRSGKEISDTAKTEQTKQELETIAFAIVGNPDLHNAGTRADFGYVGDVGALPPDLAALVNDPGYPTWNGPYLRNRFEQTADDFARDAWGVAYNYSGGTDIQSSGSGSLIIRSLAATEDQILRNRITGSVVDVNGTPPGTIYQDSLLLLLSYPNGSGGSATATALPDAGGYFSFDSIPIGNHRLALIYAPYSDTITRFLSLSPGAELYTEFRMTLDLWSGSAGGAGGNLVHINGSDTAWGGIGQCDDISFWIENAGSTAATISSMTVTWISPTAYYETIKWGNPTIFNEQNPRVGSAELAVFKSTQTIAPGSQVRIRILNFSPSLNGGNAKVAMNNVSFQISLSDGSTFTVTTGACIDA